MHWAQSFITLIALFTPIVGSQHVSAQSQLAQDTYAIFEASCLNCHGPDGAFRETLLMEHSELIDGGTVVPGNPNASELYKRLLGPTENGAQMPFGQEPLPAQSIEVVRRWILAGAPDWTITPTTLRRFITPREVLTSIESHLNSLSSFDRPFARYFTMTHLYNAGETPEILAEYRKALSKLINSLSWRLKITNPQAIDPQETIFYIDLRHYEWDRNDGWTKLEEAYPYHISFDAPEHLAIRNQLGHLQTLAKTEVPSVHIDWFIAKASTPPLYNELLSLPLTDRELETRLEVDVARNLRDAPGIKVWRAGFTNSGVSTNNRAVERHTSRYGAYWKSYDFAGSVGTQNILVNPFTFTHDGGEIIFNLPNGLQGYYLVDGAGFRLDAAPINIVSNPAASDPTVRNGISCIGCHTEGMKTFEDEVRSVIESDPSPPYNKAHALRLYVEKSEMDALVEEDTKRYLEALEATGGTFGGVEPVSRFHEAFHGPVDAAYAAAVVGLQNETFLQRVRENSGLQNVGLLALARENGRVQRDTWTSSFRDVIYALDYPGQVGEPPVVTQPDVIPGRLVDIPDANLRAVIEETLGTRTIRPNVMARLTTLKASKRDILDLTGLEFAINLKELWISGNRVSDLSPLAGCINLIGLGAWDVPVSDLSPLAGLTKLKWLEFVEGSISDISPLAGLTSLKRLVLYTQRISDISPLAGLTDLTSIRMTHNDIRDLSPLSNLINLESLIIYDNEIVDISPLSKLTKLEVLRLCDNKITDISPLRMLTNLTHLELCDNRITDISPLSGLINAKELDLHNNQISDVSPLSGLINLSHLNLSHNVVDDFTPITSLFDETNVFWSNNPGFPRGGPKIEGPWLWTWIPASHHHGWDMLEEASDGAVTEWHFATHGATEGEAVTNSVWTSHKLSPTGSDNIRELTNSLGWAPGRKLYDIVLYGCINIYSPREQETTMYLGCDDGVKVWLNGNVIFRKTASDGRLTNYNVFFPATLRKGKNVLFVALDDRNYSRWSAFFGFELGTEYTQAPPGIGYAFSETPLHLGDAFTLDIRAENVFDLAGWQFNIAFDSAVLETLDVSEGDFLKTDGGSTFFQSGRIDNAAGKITGLIAGRLSEGGASGSGSLLQVKFRAKSEGETELALQNFLFVSISEESIPAGPLDIHITVGERSLTGDVNRDGVVNILDLLRVARQLGQRVGADSPVDVNGDGIVNIFDLTLVAQGIGGAAAAPAGGINSSTIEAWIVKARLADDGSTVFQQGIANLENLLATMIVPQETALHANYPNPFNPETWIPYQLATPSEVTLTLYDMNGGVVRHLNVGHQAAGTYQSRNRALYWDGRNRDGEPVASGLYFYTLRAGEFTATRRMLIRK